AHAQKPLDAKPVADAQSVVVAKPAAGTQRPADAKPAADAQSVVVAKPAAETQRPADAKPASDAQSVVVAKPAAETQRPADAKPAAEAQRLALANAQSLVDSSLKRMASASEAERRGARSQLASQIPALPEDQRVPATTRLLERLRQSEV